MQTESTGVGTGAVATDETDRLIERPFAQRVTRVTRRADDLEVLGDGFLRRQNRDVGARDHDLPRGPFRELKNSLDDLAVFLGQDSRLLGAGENQSQLFLRVRNIAGRRTNAEDAEDGIGCLVQRPDDRKRDEIKAAKKMREPQCGAESFSDGDVFRPELAECDVQPRDGQKCQRRGDGVRDCRTP